MRNIAVILAGGTGSRVGGTKPKQLLPLSDGRCVLEHAVEAFEAAPQIDEIALVMHPDYLSDAQRLCDANGWRKVKRLIPGGAERWESSWHAIEAYSAEPDSALWLHDAARPFVSQRILTDIAVALLSHEAVTVAVPVTDTIYRVGEGCVKQVPPRSEYMRAQTPQAFRLAIIAEAYRRALSNGLPEATDDCGIVVKYMPETTIHIVNGEENNRKITFTEDLKQPI